MLAGATTLQCLKSVSRRNPEIFQPGHRIDQKELYDSSFRNIQRNRACWQPAIQFLRHAVFEALDHRRNVLENSTYIKLADPGHMNLPTPLQDRIMKPFKSARHLQRFVLIHDGVANLHNCPRHAMPSSDDRALRSEAMAAWREIAELGVAAYRPPAEISSDAPLPGRSEDARIRPPVRSAHHGTRGIASAYPERPWRSMVREVPSHRQGINPSRTKPHSPSGARFDSSALKEQTTNRFPQLGQRINWHQHWSACHVARMDVRGTDADAPSCTFRLSRTSPQPEGLRPD